MNNKGQSIILVAGITLGFLLIFAVLAIDFSRMYYVRGELQSAADSAALAGADKLRDTNLTDQLEARTEAINFAAKNTAAKSAVVLASNGSNTLSPANDITVGNWNQSRPLADRYHPNETPVNAVQVRARRTADAPGGSVPLIFGKIIPGLADMGVSRVAIAELPPKANSFVSICVDACPAGGTWPNIQVLDPARIMQTGPGATGPSANLFAWTSLLGSPTAPGFSLNDLICGSTANAEVCGQNIYTTMGAATDTLRNLESVYADPATSKVECPSFVAPSDCPAGGTGWWVIVPVTETCPPGASGGWDPKLVTDYALIRIKTVCATGSAGCRGYDACDKYVDATGNHVNVLVIDRISCISCADSANLPGFKAVLVK